MSRSATVRFELWGEERTFCLTNRQLELLQEKCDAGPQWIEAVVAGGMAKDFWITETLRRGLVGGGLDEKTAERLIRLYPLADMVLPALTVLRAAIVGAPDEQLKKSVGETRQPTPIFPEAKSAGGNSTDGAAQWASISAT
jgi:Phage tail tube protein, GTA-gp10